MLAQARLQGAVDRSWQLFLGAAILLAGHAWPTLSWAASNDIQGVICDVALGLKDGAGPLIGTIAVAVLGVGALLGKTSWTLALTTIIGIAILTGADTILTELYGRRYGNACPGTSTIKLNELLLALCRIVATMTGSQGMIAKALASLAIIIMSYSAFFGRISWGVALTVSIGIATLFGAVGIMTAVYGYGSDPVASCQMVTLPPRSAPLIIRDNVHPNP